MGIRPKLRAAGTVILLAGCALLAACSVFGGRAGYGLPPAPLLPDDLASLSCEDLQSLYSRLDHLLYDIEEDEYDFGDPSGALEDRWHSVAREQDQVAAAYAQKCGGHL